MQQSKMFLLILAIGFNASIFAQKIILKKSGGIVPINTEITEVKHKGKSALKVKAINGDKSALVLIPNTEFTNGVIEFEMAAERSPDAHPQSRGFAGLAFHLNDDNSAFDCIYLRATNGRAEEQVRRNHTVQYMAQPDYDFQVLREKFPEKYETYVDIVPGEWTKLKIVVKDRVAKLYVHKQGQPTLIVKDMLNKTSMGKIALWVGGGTDAYFRKIKLSKE